MPVLQMMTLAQGAQVVERARVLIRAVWFHRPVVNTMMLPFHQTQLLFIFWCIYFQSFTKWSVPLHTYACGSMHLTSFSFWNN